MARENYGTWPRPTGDGGKFQINLLHQQELDIIKKTHAQSNRWLKGVWKWILLFWGVYWTAETLNEFLKASRFDIDEMEIAEAVRKAFEEGIYRAERDLKTPPSLDYTPEIELPLNAHEGAPSSRKVRVHAMWFARTTAALKMREWADGMRDDVRWQVVQAIKEGIPKEFLARRLEDRWDRHGQNFTAIAATELNTAYNSGYLLAMPEHAYVTVPPIHDDKVCRYCKTYLEGKVFEVLHVAPANPTKFQLETCLWPGKGMPKDKNYPAVPGHVSCRHRIVYLSGAPFGKGWVSSYTRTTDILLPLKG